MSRVGELSPQIKKYLDETAVAANTNKQYKCRVSRNKIQVELDISYRNSFAPTLDLEIFPVENKTRINAVVSSLFSDDLSRRIIIVLILIVSFGLLILQTVRFFGTTFNLTDWVFGGVCAAMFSVVNTFI